MDLYAGSASFTFSCQLDILFQLPSKLLPYVAIAEAFQTRLPSVITPTVDTGAVSVRSRQSGPTSPPVRRHQGNFLAFGLQRCAQLKFLPRVKSSLIAEHELGGAERA